ncbi:HlyD family type I secretion periplasmic adaptor subunit [Oricola cellulosilytica]|uniref:Membrane fusion protein (MFP) family protein n=1 Tax=Oricola cellulosilytica TaxID=1429082 RepID=A0A4V2MN42_9HYPH|nr:HlyD family type I secretion periplasmic adaptor subunit [Oricola cellulosilytica]TCD11300.1 HlyD family type I secretion periplasmic adaptor subunit [Oricola cellulosilytica]
MLEAGRVQPEDWARDVRTGTVRIAGLGYLALVLFAAGFGYWAATVPLSGAAIASGIIAAAGQNQAVQHLEGGIIRKINIREGELVKAGDPLFTLDDTRQRAVVNSLASQLISLRARKARLEAQRDRAPRIAFPEEFVARAEGYGLERVLKEQQDEYAARLDRYTSEIAILQQRAAASEQVIKGLQSQLRSLREQLGVVEEETARKKELLQQGLTNRSEYTALLRTQSDLVGQIGAISAQIEEARSRITEAKEQLVRQETRWVESTLTELNEVSAGITETEEEMRAAEDVASRLTVRAPSDGAVIRIYHNSPGSVVRPGEKLADLLPTNSELIVEARLDISDIDLVRIGQHAELRFIALNARTTPQVSGTVAFVSPDRSVDQSTQQAFYVARLRINEDLPPEIKRDQIYPGMPVEAFISTGERTFFEYLVKPMMDSFSRAFREE